MIILVDPVLDCGFNCDYCYNQQLHSKTDKAFSLSAEELEGMKKNIYKYAKKFPNTTISFHGGEPTQLNNDQFRELMDTIADAHAKNNSDKNPSVQTNGYFLTDEILDIISDYDIIFSYSYDGPWPLSKCRGSGSLENRKRQAEIVKENIKRAQEVSRQVNIISVISKAHMETANADELMIEWAKEAEEDLGIRHMKINPVNYRKGKVEKPYKMIKIYKKLIEHNFSNLYNMTIEPVEMVKNMLLGKKRGACSYNQCNLADTTGAALVITPHGVENCLRSSQTAGSNTQDDAEVNYGICRSRILLNKPYEDGGCMVEGKPCDYWLVCGGLCGGFTLDGTFWTRSGTCKVYKEGIFPYTEKKIRNMLGEDVRLASDFVRLGHASYRRLLNTDCRMTLPFVYEDIYDHINMPKKKDKKVKSKVKGEKCKSGPKFKGQDISFETDENIEVNRSEQCQEEG